MVVVAQWCPSHICLGMLDSHVVKMNLYVCCVVTTFVYKPKVSLPYKVKMKSTRAELLQAILHNKQVQQLRLRAISEAAQHGEWYLVNHDAT